MANQSKVVDVNQASLEELSAVPGMGPALAEKVIAGRPYARLEELTRVRGIGSTSLRPMLAYLTVDPVQVIPEEPGPIMLVAETIVEPLDIESGLESPAASPDLESSAPPQAQMVTQTPADSPMEDGSLLRVESEETPPADSALIRADDLPVVEQTIEPVSYAMTHVPGKQEPPPPVPQSTVSKPKGGRFETAALAVGIGLLVLILGLVLSLGILRLVNGTLSFASASQVNTLQTRLDTISNQVESLQQDVAGLRSRMDALDALSGRVSSVEKQAQAIQDNLLATQAQVATLQEQNKQMSDQIAQLQTQINVFQRFLDGMRTLFANLFPGPAQ